MGFKGPAAAAATGGQGLGWVPPTQQQKEKSAGVRNKDEIASGGLSLYHVEEKKEELSKEGTRIIWEQNIGNDLNGVDGGLMGLKQTVKGKGMDEWEGGSGSTCRGCGAVLPLPRFEAAEGRCGTRQSPVFLSVTQCRPSYWGLNVL